MNAENTCIGWIGTGLMGAPMAMHLIRRGYPLFVHNRTRTKASELLQTGANWCDSPAEVASHADVIFTMVGYPRDVETTYFGEQGLFKTLKAGSVVVDMTTTLPSLAVRIAETANRVDCQALDAPVSGGPPGAIAGTLSIMVGGDKAAMERIQPLLQALGENIVHQGPPGSGQHSKMCNQIVVAGTLIGVCETLLYGYRAGLDLKSMLASISRGAASCWSLDVLAPKILAGDYEPGFFVEHFVKDLGIALREAELMGLHLPGLKLASELYENLAAMGHGKLGIQALYKALAQMARNTAAN